MEQGTVDAEATAQLVFADITAEVLGFAAITVAGFTDFALTFLFDVDCV